MLDNSANPANAGGILGIWLNGAIRISAAVSATRSKCACVSFMLWCVCLDNTIGFTSAQEQEENSGLAHKASLFYYCPFFLTIPYSHPPISYTFFSLQYVTPMFPLVAFLVLSLSLKLPISFSLRPSNYALNSPHPGGQDEIDLPLCEFRYLRQPCSTAVVLKSS